VCFVSWLSIIVSLFRVGTITASAFKLIHSDVWDPCRVLLVKRVRYFLLFIDDFSCMTWLYLLKKRSEVFSVIELFFNEIKISFIHLFVFFVLIMP